MNPIITTILGYRRPLPTAGMAATTGSLSAYISLLRPKQWLKNFFVLAPLIFSRELFQTDPLVTALRAFLAFCLTASAVYVLNDITDIESDRIHPEKKHRPLPSGTIPRQHAYGIAIVLVFLAALISAGMAITFISVLATYLLINLAYSVRLKEVMLLDVFIVAAGFMLRVLGGAGAIGVEVSSWIVLCTLFISLFLGFAKRRGEIVSSKGVTASPQRKVLSLYSVEFLDQMLTISAAGAVISYALYTVAPRTIEMYGTDGLIYSTVFVLYGVFRYLYLIHSSSTIENPTQAVTSDLTILATGVLWIVSCVLFIYFGSQISSLLR